MGINISFHISRSCFCIRVVNHLSYVTNDFLSFLFVFICLWGVIYLLPSLKHFETLYFMMNSFIYCHSMETIDIFIKDKRQYKFFLISKIFLHVIGSMLKVDSDETCHNPNCIAYGLQVSKGIFAWIKLFSSVFGVWIESARLTISKEWIIS